MPFFNFMKKGQKLFYQISLILKNNNNKINNMQKNRQGYHQNRQYFSLIQKVGSWNRYQLILFIIFTSVSLFDSALMFILPLLFNHATYQCGQTSGEQCTKFVCSLDPSERIQYRTDVPFHSLGQDLGLDFQCQHTSTITLFSMLLFIGSIGGMFIFTFFTEQIGRKKSLILSVAIMSVGLALTLLGGYLKSIPVIAVALIFTYCGCQNGYQYVYCFSTQVIAEEWRISFVNLLNVIYGFGMVLDAIVFFYIKDWVSIYIYVFLIPAIITLIAIIFIVEKTPLDMISTETEGQIMERLKRIANINNNDFTVTVQQVRHLKQDYTNSVNNAAHKSFTIVDLFEYKSLRKVLIPLIFFNFTVNYLFYSPSVINNSISNNLFNQSLIEGFSYSLSVIAIHFFLEHVTRRKTNFIISSAILAFEFLLLAQGQDKGSSLYSIFYFGYRFVVSMAFLSVYLMNYESYPTQIRAVGATLGYLIGNTSGIIQPYLAQIWKEHGWNILYSFIVICILSFIPNYFLKETFKVPPPEIIEELEPNQKEKGEGVDCSI